MERKAPIKMTYLFYFENISSYQLARGAPINGNVPSLHSLFFRDLFTWVLSSELSGLNGLEFSGENGSVNTNAKVFQLSKTDYRSNLLQSTKQISKSSI